MRLSVIASAVVAALVGISGALAVVLAAAQAVGATPAETTSWVTALCLSMALTSGILSFWHKVPVITAWSTPGAAVIAASVGVAMPQAVGAFIVAAVLLMATALIAPLGRLVERIPVPIASAMLAGVLLRFVVQLMEAVRDSPALVLSLVGLFLVLRVISPALAVIAVIVAGSAAAGWLGLLAGVALPKGLSTLVWVTPVFDPSVLVGLGIPLYIVTMASQNLPGAAVIKAAGYKVPFASSVGVTGLASLIIAPFCGSTINLAAITAAICTSPDAHPDATKRWQTGVAYMIVYPALGALGAALVGVFTAFPAAIIKTVAALGLIGSLTGALTAAVGDERLRIAAIATFTVTASGVSILGVGSAFWGLAAGLVVVAVEAAVWCVRSSRLR
jgi:benzoate membrane transport protein